MRKLLALAPARATLLALGPSPPAAARGEAGAGDAAARGEAGAGDADAARDAARRARAVVAERLIDARLLQPDDVVLVRGGEAVPCDGVLVRDLGASGGEAGGEAPAAGGGGAGGGAGGETPAAGGGAAARAARTARAARARRAAPRPRATCGSTSRWSRASRCPCANASATRSSAARSTSARCWARATAVGADTALAAIARLVDDAQSSRAPVEAFADYVAARFVPSACRSPRR